MTKPEETLSRRERQIMDIIYRRGSATAVEVLRELPPPPVSKSAVRSFLRILEENGHLQHALHGQTYVYRASQSRQKAGRSALRRVLDTFFDASLEKALAAHLSDENVELSAEELSRLLRLIKESRLKGR